MSDEKRNDLTDAQLDDVSGGMQPRDPPSSNARKLKNSRGYTVSEVSNDKIYYYPCPKCGKPTFVNWSTLHCEPCDDWWWSLDKAIWTGTEQSLISTVG